MKKPLVIRGYLINVGILCVTIFLMGMAGELYLRGIGWCVRNLKPGIHQPSRIEGLNFELRRSLSARGFGCEIVKTNADGFRSPPLTGKPIVAVLGDSFTFGFGVENDETNPAVFQEKFPAYDVINAGVNGYTIEQETLVYEHKIAPLKPSLVILEFVINDAEIKASYDGIKASEPTPRLLSKRRLKNWIKSRSAFVDFAIRQLERRFAKPSAPPHVVEWTDEQFEFYASWFERLSASIGSTPKIFVLWPDFSPHPQTFRRLSILAEKNGWHVFDLSPILGVDYERLGWDSHPNAETQRRAGEAIVDYVQQM